MLPKGYSLRVAPPQGAERVVHVFDAAGEVFASRERTQELRYLRIARTFLFVVDPLSVESFRLRVPPDRQPPRADRGEDGPGPPGGRDQQDRPGRDPLNDPYRKARLLVLAASAFTVTAVVVLLAYALAGR